MKPTKFTRRQFINGALCGASLAAVRGLVHPSLAFASGYPAPQMGKFIIDCDIAGGWDDQFIFPWLNAFATSLAAVRPNITPPANNRLDILNGTRGAHIRWSTIQNLFTAGNVKLVQACNLANASQSHEVASNSISNAARNQQGIDGQRGWIAELKKLYDLGLYQVVGISSQSGPDLNCETTCLQVSDYSSFDYANRRTEFGGGLGSEYSRETLAQAIAQMTPSDNPAEELFMQGIAAVEPARAIIAAIRQVPTTGRYWPVEFDGSGGTTIGKSIRQIGQTIKWMVVNHPGENGIFRTTIGGFDTHSSQMPLDGNGDPRLDLGLPRLIWTLSEAISGLYTDLGPVLFDKVAMLLCTEFGRTMKQNGGLGTDHGLATTMMLVGGQVNGGGANSIYGPDATPSDITRNNIQPVVYYQNVINELLRWWGMPAEEVALILREAPPQVQALGLFK